MGTIFDEVAAIVVTLPLIKHFGYDLVWWGIINVTIVEIALLTPPIGLNVFVVHGMRKEIPLRTIYADIMPFLMARRCCVRRCWSCCRRWRSTPCSC